jgi:hypothetical protein
MNAIRCPNCNSINQLSALQCHQCQMPFSYLPQTAYVSVPTEQTFEAQTLGFNPPPLAMPQDNEIGRKAFFWYRVYCGFLMVMYLLVTFLGVFLAAFSPPTRQYNSEETFIMGIIYAVMGVVFFIIFAVALFLPRKPYNWIVDIIMMALGMTSCCFLPFLIPLLIYWTKPETKAYFGRN